jgi:phosphomannomutase/phosphoglucomutase
VSIFKSCDIRGRFGSELTLAHARRLGAAIRLLKGPGEVLVGGDGRYSTPQLKAALIESLIQSGCDVADLGQVSTPFFYFARRNLGIETGVMVTASHNPAADNGFKLTLGPLPVTVAEMRRLAVLMESDPEVTLSEPGMIRRVDMEQEYRAFLDGFAPELLGMRIVVDCAHGMAGPYAARAWTRTGAQVELLFSDVDGSFPAHPPNPAEAKNLLELSRAVLESGADLGVAYDGDGDRVAFVDAGGAPVPNDKVIVLFAREALRRGVETVVYDQKCSRVVADEIRAMGGTAVRELSGHTYIKRTFSELGAVYAGELSGHHFLRSVQGDDGVAASLIFAGLLRRSGLSLKDLAKTVPAYPITPDLRVPMTAEEIGRLLADLEGRLQGQAVLTRTDGLRIEFPRGWGLVRPSVTEPVVTMRFEAVDPEALENILFQVEGASSLLSGKLLPALNTD